MSHEGGIGTGTADPPWMDSKFDRRTQFRRSPDGAIWYSLAPGIWCFEPESGGRWLASRDGRFWHVCRSVPGAIEVEFVPRESLRNCMALADQVAR